MRNGSDQHHKSGGATKPYTTGFSTLTTLPDVHSRDWYSVPNSHGGTTSSYQHDLGTTGYAVKVYLNDAHHDGLNTVAIVDANPVVHAIDALAVRLGLDNDNSRNFSLGIAYLKSTGSCGAQ